MLSMLSLRLNTSSIQYVLYLVKHIFHFFLHRQAVIIDFTDPCPSQNRAETPFGQTETETQIQLA
jgi:hypothetical protein